MDVYDALRAAETEESPVGREVLAQLVENADIAAADRVPICQDTGFAVIFAEVGQDVHLVGGDFEEAVDEGVRQGYGDGYLRKSVAEEPGHARRNTKDNTPAIIHTSIVPGDKVLPHDDGQGRRRREHELAQHAQAGAGLGRHGRRRRRHRQPRRLQPVPAGDHRRRHRRHHRRWSRVLAKKALLRDVGSTHPDPRIAAMEDELLEKINALGIGPQGLGGTHHRARRLHRGDALPHRQHADGRQRPVPRAAAQDRRRSEGGETMAVKKITTPLTDEVVRDLRAGDAVEITGVIYQARDAAHKRLVALIEAGEDAAVRARRAPSSTTWGRARPSPATSSARPGPTTSGRMDAYAPLLMRHGLKGMIGKGLRTAEVKQAMQRRDRRVLRRHRRRRRAARQAHRRQRGHRLARARRRGGRAPRGRGLPGDRRQRLPRRRPLRGGPRAVRAARRGAA